MARTKHPVMERNTHRDNIQHTDVVSLRSRASSVVSTGTKMSIGTIGTLGHFVPAVILPPSWQPADEFLSSHSIQASARPGSLLSLRSFDVPAPPYTEFTASPIENLELPSTPPQRITGIVETDSSDDTPRPSSIQTVPHHPRGDEFEAEGQPGISRTVGNQPRDGTDPPPPLHSIAVAGNGPHKREMHLGPRIITPYTGGPSHASLRFGRGVSDDAEGTLGQTPHSRTESSHASFPSPPPSPTTSTANTLSAYYTTVVRTIDTNHRTEIERLEEDYRARIEQLETAHTRALAETRNSIDAAYRIEFRAARARIAKIEEECASENARNEKICNSKIETMQTEFDTHRQITSDEVGRLGREIQLKEDELLALKAYIVEAEWKARNQVEDVWEERWRMKMKLAADDLGRMVMERDKWIIEVERRWPGRSEEISKVVREGLKQDAEEGLLRSNA